MEFYVRIARFADDRALFQFPTGWNSTCAHTTFCMSWRSFNSQRDGILPRYLAYIAGFKPFQFPTGWNSTAQRAFALSLVNCFNSQRDGILLTFAVGSCMNTCFNSQRDGILRLSGFIATAKQKFQFPTGWNSTARILPFF